MGIPGSSRFDLFVVRGRFFFVEILDGKEGGGVLVHRELELGAWDLVGCCGYGDDGSSAGCF